MGMSTDGRIVLMEDHCDAFPAWREMDVSEGVCVHLDAHLDVSDEGFPPSVLEAIRSTRDAEDLRRFRSNPKLPWGGYHAGNYLYPALLDGTVSHLYWVIPPWLPRGRDLLEWTRSELQNWYQVTLDDYASLHLEGGRVQGRLLGHPFTLCTVDHLPRFDHPVLLDIDVDYFLDRDDTVFAGPDEILERLHERLVHPVVTTVSYSVNGGYTPLEHRYAGDLLAWLAGSPDTANAEAGRAMMRGDRARAAGDWQAALADYERALSQGGMFAAPALYKMSLALADGGRTDEAERQAEEAAALDENYCPRAIDIAFVWFRRRDYARTLEWLQRARVDDPSAIPLTRYIEGLAHLREKQLRRAVEAFEPLVDEPSLRPAERAYLSVMLARTLLREGRAADAVPLLRKATEVDPSNGLYHIHLAHGLRDQLLHEEAARHYRKAIALAGHTLAGLEAHRSLAEVYDACGQKLLADAERRRLVQKDVVGTFAMQAMLNRNKPT